MGLAAAAVAAAILGLATSFLVMRGTDLTKLMVTLGVALVLGEIGQPGGVAPGGADGLQGVMIKPSSALRVRPLGHPPPTPTA